MLWFFFPLTLLIHLEFILMAGQGLMPKTHMTSWITLTASSSHPAQGLWKRGEQVFLTEVSHLHFTKDLFHKHGSSDLCPTLPLATLLGAIPWSLGQCWPKAWVLRTYPLPSLLVFLGVTLKFTKWGAGGSEMKLKVATPEWCKDVKKQNCRLRPKPCRCV